MQGSVCKSFVCTDCTGFCLSKLLWVCVCVGGDGVSAWNIGIDVKIILHGFFPGSRFADSIPFLFSRLVMFLSLIFIAGGCQGNG